MDSHLFRKVVYAVEVRVNQAHDVPQRLALELAHVEDAVVQSGACASAQGFLH